MINSTKDADMNYEIPDKTSPKRPNLSRFAATYVYLT